MFALWRKKAPTVVEASNYEGYIGDVGRD